MSLRSLLIGVSEVNINDIDGGKIKGELRYLETNRYQPYRCDVEVGGQQVASFGESKQQAIKNLIEFIRTHPFTH